MNHLAAAITRCLVAAALIAGAFAATPVSAGDESYASSPGWSRSGSGGCGGSHHIAMPVGKSCVITLPTDAAEIFVGNPKVANAVVRSARKLYVIAADKGQTSIFAMDRNGNQIADFEISVGDDSVDIAQLQSLLRAVLPEANVVARAIGGTIILTGTVDSAGDAQQAMDVANGFVGKSVTVNTSGQMDKSNGTLNASTTAEKSGKVINALTIRGKDQVMLKVSIVEVQRNVLKNLGINLVGNWINGSSIATALPVGQAAGTFTKSTGLVTVPGSAGQQSSLGATLQAFEQYGVSRILAEPTVTAISGESAKFTAGGEIPVPSAAPVCSGSGSSSCAVGIEFKQYGVTLNFSPVVLSEGRILLRIATEVTEIDTDHSATYSGFSIPAFSTRKNETSVELPSGASIVSAGLLQVSNRNTITGLPGLMNLPVLGTLFRSRQYQRSETELVIIVTPYIARSLKPEEVARPDDGFADASDPQGWFLGRVNRLYSTTDNPQALHNFKGQVGFIND